MRARSEYGVRAVRREYPLGIAIPILLLFPAFLGSTNLARAADCAASSICGPYENSNCTDYTVPQQSGYFSTTFACSIATSQVVYDLVAGTIQGSSFAKAPAGAGSIATGVDDFTIVGVPSGLPAQIVASIHVVLTGQTDPLNCDTSGDGAVASGSLTDVTGNQTVSRREFAGGHWFPCVTSFSVDTTLSLLIHCVTGQPFRISYAAGSEVGGYYGSTNMSELVSLHFDQLPAGAVVVSCQGYASGPIVSTNVTTWGRVKSLYR